MAAFRSQQTHQNEFSVAGTQQELGEPHLSSCIVPDFRELPAVLDISLIVNRSPWVVPPSFNLSMTYHLFRSVGLRHLVVVDGEHVVGMITRKDLLPHRLRERLLYNPMGEPVSSSDGEPMSQSVPATSAPQPSAAWRIQQILPTSFGMQQVAPQKISPAENETSAAPKKTPNDKVGLLAAVDSDE